MGILELDGQGVTVTVSTGVSIHDFHKATEILHSACLVALAYAFIDRAMQADSQTISAVQALSAVDATLPMLKAAGFQDMVYEDWYDVLASLIRQILVPEPEGTVLTPAILLEAFQSDEGTISVS